MNRNDNNNSNNNIIKALNFQSGTDSSQKAAMLSHDNIIFNAKICVKYMELERQGERILSYLPLSHIAPQVL